ncbi:MAG: ABC transporter ATP-binding protein [Candidatus Eiseniibacteriota bacterium]|nr:MAG: ABC transporter ATP-binding protein [Candidatus Eisenbacteria bacterium]
MIEVKDVRKSYGDVAALGGISFTVREGEIFGFLGPNGAGKTTAISIISGLLLADSGTVRVADMDIRKDSRRIRKIQGVVPQEIALYEELTGRENLHFWGSLYGLVGGNLRGAADRVLELVGLSERANDPVRTYSGGMKRRINLCVGLMHRPRILLLDEPTLGIDPQARLNILDIIRGEVSGGTTVIYTTHYLEEAENLCDRIAIIDHGQILAEGTLQQLTQLVGEEDIVMVTGNFTDEQVRPLLSEVKVEHLEDGAFRALVPDSGAIGKLLGRFFSAGVHVGEVSIKEPSLESVFIKLTGRELRD